MRRLSSQLLGNIKLENLSIFNQTIKIALTPSSESRSISIRRFEELFEIDYYPHLLFSDYRAEQWLKNKCARALKKEKIGDLALWLGKLHGHEIETAQIPNITIRWIGDQIGYGLFTNEPIKKWAFVGEYTGRLRRRNHFFSNVNDYCFIYPREWIAIKAFTIDSQKQGNYTRFINHSDCPNLESLAVLHGGFFRIIFRTIQPIPAGVELTYDYGDIYWHRRKKLQNFS